MPNYLARVAAAGARTSTSIRPPVSAPPVMPGPGLFEPPWAAEMEAEVMPPATAETDRPLDVQPAPTSPAFGATPARAPIAELPPEKPASEAPSSGSSAAPAVTPPVAGSAALPPPAIPFSPRVELPRKIEGPMLDEVIRAPRSLRSAPPPEALSATADAGHSENVPAEAPVQPRTPMPGISERAAGPARAPTAASVQHSANLSTEAPVWPRAPMLATVRQHPALEPAEPLPDLAAAVAAPPVTPAAIAPRTEVPALLDGVPSPAGPRQREDATVAAAAQAHRPDPEFAGWPQPPGQPGPLDPPAAAQRQSRITIGRLDVQVTNQPPPPAARPARLPGPPDRDILAGFYLDRFRLRP
jgi:hypothetical protein